MTDSYSVCGRLLGSTPATQRYKVRPCPMETHEVTVFCGDTLLAEFYSIADYSTTTGRIQVSFAGGCWARRQLRNGINYVPVASKPRISLSSVEGVLGSMLAEFYSMADYSTTVSQIQIWFAGGYCARHQLSNGIKYVPLP